MNLIATPIMEMTIMTEILITFYHDCYCNYRYYNQLITIIITSVIMVTELK